MFGIIGEKLGMTQIYDKDGAVVPVTVVRVEPNVVSSVKTKERHGYNAVQLAHGEQKPQRLSKAVVGVFAKNKLTPRKHLKEFSTERSAEYQVGMNITAACFNSGDVVDIQGVSKGKGFQGVMKRYHFSGGSDSHGNSVSHRKPGSIGQNSYPGRVIPGKKLPGHMGDRTVTVKNLEVVGTEPEQNIVLIKGALPGSKNALVYVFTHAQDFENRIFTANKPQEGTQA